MDTIESVELAEQALKADGITPSTLGQFTFGESKYALASLIDKLRLFVTSPRIFRHSDGKVSEYVIRSGELTLSEKPSAVAAWEQACRDFTPRQ